MKNNENTLSKIKELLGLSTQEQVDAKEVEVKLF